MGNQTRYEGSVTIHPFEKDILNLSTILKINSKIEAVFGSKYCSVSQVLFSTVTGTLVVSELKSILFSVKLLLGKLITFRVLLQYVFHNYHS